MEILPKWIQQKEQTNTGKSQARLRREFEEQTSEDGKINKKLFQIYPNQEWQGIRNKGRAGCWCVKK